MSLRIDAATATKTNKTRFATQAGNTSKYNYNQIEYRNTKQ